MLEIIEHQPVRELRFARPPVNALDSQLLGALDAALAQAADDRVAALLLSGQPGMFSAGLDIPALLRMDRDQIRQFWPLFFGVQSRIAASPIPVIAAITGHCPAGGTVLALYCDHRIMGRGEYRIGLNEVQIGLFPGSTIYRAFERLVGKRHAAELLTRGALLSPEEAAIVGLVDELVDPADVVRRAIEYARELAALPAGAYARTRALVRSDLAAFFTHDSDFFEAATTAWFDPETQQRLRARFERSPR